MSYMGLPKYLIHQDKSPAGQSKPEGNAGGGGDPPPSGSTNAMTKRWVDVNWRFTEPEPEGYCTGFEVAVFAGSDIDNGQLAEPITLICDPAARRHIGILELRTQINLRAAVRACYGDLRSAWTNASTHSQFIPDIQYYGDNGWLEIGNGTIMQWMKTPLMTDQAGYDFTWPILFPNVCYSVSATPQIENDQPENDNWLQLISFNRAGLRIYKQASSNASADRPIRAFIVGFGY